MLTIARRPRSAPPHLCGDSAEAPNDARTERCATPLQHTQKAASNAHEAPWPHQWCRALEPRREWGGGATVPGHGGQAASRRALNSPWLLGTSARATAWGGGVQGGRRAPGHVARASADVWGWLARAAGCCDEQRAKPPLAPSRHARPPHPSPPPSVVCCAGPQALGQELSPAGWQRCGESPAYQLNR